MIAGEGRTIYFSGDTDVMADMGVFEELHHPEIGILCAGGHFTMDMERAAFAARKFFNFETVIPCHYRTFPLLEQSAEKLVAGLPGVRVLTPRGDGDGRALTGLVAGLGEAEPPAGLSPAPSGALAAEAGRAEAGAGLGAGAPRSATARARTATGCMRSCLDRGRSRQLRLLVRRAGARPGGAAGEASAADPAADLQVLGVGRSMRRRSAGTAL